MKITDGKPATKAIKLDNAEKYTRLFSTKNGTALSFRSGCVILRESESIGEHSTDNSEEIIIILEGEGELYINGHDKIYIEKDTAVYVPPHTIHDVKNAARRCLKYVFITCSV